MNRKQFENLKQQWKEDTWHMASPKEKAIHPAYQQIIGGGDEAVEYIIDDLRESPDHWFWALRSITGEDVIPEDHYGRMDKMAQDWIDWYEEQQ